MGLMQVSHSYQPDAVRSVHECNSPRDSSKVRFFVAATLLTVFSALSYYHLAPPVTIRVALTAALGACLYLPALVECDNHTALWFALFVTPAAYVSFVVFPPGQPLALVAGVSCVASALCLAARGIDRGRRSCGRLLTVLGHAFVVGGVGAYYAFLIAVFAAAELIT